MSLRLRLKPSVQEPNDSRKQPRVHNVARLKLEVMRKMGKKKKERERAHLTMVEEEKKLKKEMTRKVKRVELRSNDGHAQKQHGEVSTEGSTMGTDGPSMEMECGEDATNGKVKQKESCKGKKGKKLSKSQVKRRAKIENGSGLEVEEEVKRLDKYLTGEVSSRRRKGCKETSLKDLTLEEKAESEDISNETSDEEDVEPSGSPFWRMPPHMTTRSSTK